MIKILHVAAHMGLESSTHRSLARLSVTQVPLTHHVSLVASPPHQLGQRHHAWSQTSH